MKEDENLILLREINFFYGNISLVNFKFHRHAEQAEQRISNCHLRLLSQIKCLE